jgi:hypothetical protein
MNEINIYFEECQDCWGKVNMMEMIVKETADGNCIYCPKCVEHHKFLEKESERLCKLWGIDPIKYGKEVEKEEKRQLKANKEK